MEKNPNSWRLLSIFFAMVMLFALGSVEVSGCSIDRSDPVSFVNLPPGQDIIAITVIENAQINNQPEIVYQIARGVSVPDKGLISPVAIYNVNENQKPVFCILNRYYCQSMTGPDIDTLPKGINVATSNFAADLGVRYTSSVS